MKICYLAHVRLPTEKAHGAQIMKTCEALSGERVVVSLLVPGRKTSIDSDAFSYYGVSPNFEIKNLRIPDLTPFGGFALSMLLFSEAAKWQKEFWHADVIYSRDAFVLLQYVLLGRKLVYEAHTKPTFISKIVARLAYRVVVISEGLHDAYVRAHVPRERIVVAHDAIDPDSFLRTYNPHTVRRDLGIPFDKRVVLYVGRIDRAKGVETLARASELLPEDTQIVIIGDGPEKGVLQEMFPRVLFLPQTPYRDIGKVLSAADILVLPNSGADIDASRYTSPLKAFAYLASGKPIVASDVPALRAICEKNTSFFTPDDSRALVKAILHPPLPLPLDPRQYSWSVRARSILQGLSYRA